MREKSINFKTLILNRNISIPNSIHAARVWMVLLAAAFIITTVIPSFGAEFDKAARDKILEEYYPPALVQRMMDDARAAAEKFDGINIFSTAQYGDRFLTGIVDLGDVFDARIPENLAVFKKYARDNLLILNVDDSSHYNKYAMAADRFMKELGYDAVIFYPDEFHPVFTGEKDAWLFIREEPAGKEKGYYISNRLKNRRFAVTGGLPTAPKASGNHFIYYIPEAGAQYTTYKFIPDENSTTTETIFLEISPDLSADDISRLKEKITKIDGIGKVLPVEENLDWVDLKEKLAAGVEVDKITTCKKKNVLQVIVKAQEYLPPVCSLLNKIPEVKSFFSPSALTGELTNRFKPVEVTGEMRAKRKALGITESPLSGRKKVKAGLWTGGLQGDIELCFGAIFRGTGHRYTWGDKGFYAIPLEEEFWNIRNVRNDRSKEHK